jgi:RNA polymerase sigma-70 factor (ECF subfamily)
MYNADLAPELAWQVAGEGVRSLPIDSDAEFTALVERQSHFVFRVVYAVLLNSYDAEDAVQETFLKLYRNRGWKQADNERAFLARVAWRTAVDMKRHLSSSNLSSADSAPLEALPALRPNPEETLASSSEHTAIHALIDSLQEDLRVPLVLSTFDELNSREIAMILGIPEGTVRTRLQRARLLLRQKLISNKEARYA